jgi:hypothetical protein
MRGQSVLVKSIAGPTNTDLWYKLDLIRLKIGILLQIFMCLQWPILNVRLPVPSLHNKGQKLDYVTVMTSAYTYSAVCWEKSAVLR